MSARRTIERRVREAWRREPGLLLRGSEAAFGAGVDLRHLLFDAGLFAARRASIPVVSVGGLTVGGSGKTPLASEVAGWLAAAGRRPAIVTRGFPDELAVHRALRPEAVVAGHPDRLRAVDAAAEAGAEIAVLDDGFQHRRLARDLDLVLVDTDALARTNRRRLPAGPFRERPAEVARAGAVVVVRRGRAERLARRVVAWLGRRLPAVPVARCVLRPGQPRPANPAAAGAGGPPAPAAALTGIMKPRLFFRQVRRRWPDVALLRAFPDHGAPSGKLLEECVREAGGRGMVCTLKDVEALRTRLPDDLPLWYLPDELAWEEGREGLRAAVLRAVRAVPQAIEGPRHP